MSAESRPEPMPDELERWLDGECDRLLASARAGCYCEPNRKPCVEHSAYEDGLCDLADAVLRRGRVERAS